VAAASVSSTATRRRRRNADNDERKSNNSSRYHRSFVFYTPDGTTVERHASVTCATPVPHYRIAPYQKSPPAGNLPAKIRPARAGILPVNCRPRETFLEEGGGSLGGGGDPIMRRLFYEAGDILIRKDISIPRDYLSQGGFFTG